MLASDRLPGSRFNGRPPFETLAAVSVSATGADQFLRLEITNCVIKLLEQGRVPCLRLRNLLEVRFMVISGPIEEDVRGLAALVHASKRASA